MQRPPFVALNRVLLIDLSTVFPTFSGQVNPSGKIAFKLIILPSVKVIC